MPRFEFARCSSCSFLVPARRGVAAKHYYSYNTHSHQVVKQVCDGSGWKCIGEPIVVEAASVRRARSIARGELAGIGSTP